MAAIGVTDMDILFDTEKGRFSYRAAGLAVKEGRLLVQRMRGDQGLAIPGGHVAFGETAAESLRREFREELGLNVRLAGWLLWARCFLTEGTLPADWPVLPGVSAHCALGGRAPRL